MFLAPLVVLAIPVAIILWPPTLILLGLVWLVLFPFAALARGRSESKGGTGASRIARAHVWVEGWLGTLLTPWTYFDAPKKPLPKSEDEPPPPS